MKSKKPGIGSWISFEDGLLEYKESELRKEWWYYVTEDNPYVTRNERRRNKKPAPVQVVAPPPKPTTPRVIPIKPVQKAASPDKEVRPQPPNELEPIVKEAPKKTTVKKEKKEKVTKTTPETEPLKELEPVQEPEPVPEPVQKPKIVPKPIQEPEPVKELVPELVQEQEPVKELDDELCHINPRFPCEFDLTTTTMSSKKPGIGPVMEPIEGSAVSIYCDDKANPKALRAVLDRPGYRELPLVVIPFAGELRGGKSFLLSYFVRYLTNKNFGRLDEKLVGFDHKKGFKSVTQGINIWNQPLIVKGSGEKKILVLLMDTQGIFGGKDKKQASRIFALCTMLSSIMIFNLRNQINDAVLDYLTLFTAYGNEATNDENANKASFENAPEIPFQKLIILIRDWTNTHDFGSEGGKQYLEEYVKENKNVFGRYFRDISCFCIPPPGKDLAKKGASGCLNDLDDGFQQYMKEIITDLCSPDRLAEHVKSVAGSSLTAGGFCDYFESCAEKINNQDLNKSFSMVEMKADFTCNLATQEAVRVYSSYMDMEKDSFVNVTESSIKQLDEFHADAFKEAINIYEKLAIYAKRNEREIYDSKKTQRNMELNEKWATYQEHLKSRMLQQSIVKMEKSLSSFDSVNTSLEDIKDDASSLQTGVRRTKWIAAVAVVGSAVLCVTPLAPVAAAGVGVVSAVVGASGAAGAGASVVDMVYTSYAGKKIKGHADLAEKHLNECKVGLEGFIQLTSRVVGATGGTVGTAIFGLKSFEAFTSFADEAIEVAASGLKIVNGVSKVLVCVGGALAVIDAVATQVQENASISNARTLQVQIDDIIKELRTQIEILKYGLQFNKPIGF